MEDNLKLTPVIAAQPAMRDVDIMVQTARAYPRDMVDVLRKSVAIATLSRDMAESCIYAIPRQSFNPATKRYETKMIKGLSTHGARIIAQQYGNLRVAGHITEIGETMITAQGICYDLERNYAEVTEVRRKIVGSDGRRYSEDMIVITANAAISIATRNAIARVVPQHVINEVLRAVEKTIATDPAISERLAKTLAMYRDKLQLSDVQIANLIDKSSVEEISADDVPTLIAIAQAIKDGEISINEIKAPEENEGAEKIKKVIESIKSKKS